MRLGDGYKMILDDFAHTAGGVVLRRVGVMGERRGVVYLILYLVLTISAMFINMIDTSTTANSAICIEMGGN